MNEISATQKQPKRLSVLVLILIVLQPLLDIFSYFWANSGHGNLLTLALRMGLLAAAAIYGFWLSRRKWAYLAAAGVCTVFWAIHALVCFQAGYISPFSDFTNYVRVVQIIVYTLCFITFLSQGAEVFRAALLGICVNLLLCALVMLLSVLTDTNPHTYTFNQLGVLGWFSTTNSQSAILSVSAPIALMLALLYDKRGQYLLLALTTAICFSVLYFIGTRLAYVSALACAVGLPVIMALCRQWNTKKAAVLFLGALVLMAAYTRSPMYQNLHIYDDAMVEKQGYAAAKMDRAEESLGEEDAASGSEASQISEARRIRILTPVYEWCASNIVDRFGVEAVIRKYNFSSDVQEITAVRQQKIYFCQMLQDELPVTAKIFGMELGRMEHKGQIYDVENDFYGIYFLYGIVGLLLLFGFIGYFLVLIVKALARDAKTYFTPMAGAIGMALIIILVYAFCTAGVLRRPNASFYLSLLLAMVYYLVKQKDLSKGAEKDV